MDTASEFVDYYELLGVPTNADAKMIRLAFLKLAKQHHPDVGGSTERMQELTRAYRTLMSASRRKAYDMLHDFHTDNGQAQYRDYGAAEGSSLEDQDDAAIDDFLDSVYAEYHVKSQQKTPLLTKIKHLFD